MNERQKLAKEQLPMILHACMGFGCVVSIGLHAAPLTGWLAEIWSRGEVIRSRSWCEAGHGHTMEEAVYNAWMMKLGKEKYIPSAEFESANIV